MADLKDATLDEIRAALIGDVAGNAAFDGWTARAVAAAAAARGVDPDVAKLAWPGGAIEMIDAWFADIDRRMLAKLPPEVLATMKVRQRIAGLVEARLALLAGSREALRRALAVLAMPQNLPRAARLGWRSADVMWRAAGDTATDYNHYTKRAMLGGVHAATVQVFLGDDSDGHAETSAFLQRRIDGIMAFEKTKAGVLMRAQRRPSLSRFVGRLRYPVR
ncbi:COQ9 family protein [Sphingomonas sp.]|uniref:COQ9 family protein n=1 Tax=Sphingomonas sp. TaxID=28214 RepID=UPI002CB13A65|nr:COQ9 family protein [Sphingomonas sp.]HWK36061.1 COQ9 family protein [Sphingomonas sp.]